MDEVIGRLHELVEPDHRWETCADAHTTSRLALLDIADALEQLAARVDGLGAQGEVHEGLRSLVRELVGRRAA